jgi:hypothetical protein
MDRLNVLLYESSCRRRVNAGFQNPKRPAWYRATQEIIVPKEPLFDLICRRTVEQFAGVVDQLVVFEPGVGLSSFFEFVLTKSRLPELFALHLVGADLSHEMVRAGRDVLAAIQPKASWRQVQVELHSRVNLLELGSADVQLVLRHKPFHVIAALQFEHSFPNHADSPLARRLGKGPGTVPTKTDFRLFVHKHLNRNGLYFALDDYTSGRGPEDEAQLQAWDRYVVDRLSDPHCLQELAERFPSVAAALSRKYDQRQGLESLLRKVANARQRRRSLCNEESADLQSTVADLRSIFGDEVGLQRHPWRQSHGLFYLVCATARPREDLHSRLDSQPGSWQGISENHGTVASS